VRSVVAFQPRVSFSQDLSSESAAKAAPGIIPTKVQQSVVLPPQVEDIIDTGATLKAVIAKLQDLGAASVKSAVLLNKEERRNVEIEPDYAALKVPSQCCRPTAASHCQRIEI